ncbi:MAG TPA: hypothetical protein VGG28_00620 [Kofleriaceae bacterium]|jgi:hypothetical protein
MRRSLWLFVAAACGSPSPTAGPVAPSNHVDINDPNATHPFAIDRRLLPDCTPRSVLAQATIGLAATRCADLAADATPAQAGAALHCVADAVAHQTPFVFHQMVQGIDSSGGFGMLGRMSAGSFVVDELWYDSDPCGGSCPERGHTDVVECAGYARNRETDCRPTLHECFTCDRKRMVATCVAGGSASR